MCFIDHRELVGCYEYFREPETQLKLCKELLDEISQEIIVQQGVNT